MSDNDMHDQIVIRGLMLVVVGVCLCFGRSAFALILGLCLAARGIGYLIEDDV